MTKKEQTPKVRLSPEVRKALAELGRIGGLKGGAKGGAATARNRTPEERRAAMKKALDARWAKVRAAKGKATASVPKKPTREKT